MSLVFYDTGIVAFDLRDDIPIQLFPLDENGAWRSHDAADGI